MAISLKAAVFTLLLAVPAPALAQSSLALFVDGGPVLNQDRTWGGLTVRNAGLSVGGGARIGSRTEVRILLERPPATTLSSTHQAYTGLPPVVFAHVTTRERVRNQTISVMVGRLFPIGARYTVTTSLGMSSTRRSDGSTTITEHVNTGARTEAPTTRAPGWAGPVFGAGAIVAITKHFSVVPEARLIWDFGAEVRSSVIYRTALNARWTF
jgi:hypothetical protein